MCIRIIFWLQNTFQMKPSFPYNSHNDAQSETKPTKNYGCFPLRNAENLGALKEKKGTTASRRKRFPASQQKSFLHLFHRGGQPLCPHHCQQTRDSDAESLTTSNRGHSSSRGMPWNPLGWKVGAEAFLSTIITEDQRKQWRWRTMERSSSSQPFHDPDKSRSRDSGSNLAWAWVTAQMNCFNKSALVN